MPLYKAFRWVQPLQEPFFRTIFNQNFCFFWCLILDVIFRDFSATWCQNWRFCEPLAPSWPQNGTRNLPSGAKLSNKKHPWCSHFPFLDFLASKRCIRASATLHSGQCNVAFGPFWDDLCNDMLLDLGRFLNDFLYHVGYFLSGLPNYFFGYLEP